MQNDERDPRDVPPDERGDAPPDERPDDEDEFETASWPVQDVSAAASPSTPEAVQPDAAPEADATEAEAPPVADAGPPPPEVEAYATPPAAAAPVVAAHSVPATEPGESTLCPRCRTENRPGIAFCRSCGQRLVAAGAPTTVERPSPPDGTQACPRCGTHNRAGVAFCQNCGANLRAGAQGWAPGAAAATAASREGARNRAILGPVVLLIGAIGIATAWLLPFPFGAGSLYDRAFGAPGGYGIAFWSAYDGIDGLAAQAYFGFAAPAPLLVALLILLAVGGLLRPAPAIIQLAGLVVALVWAVGLAILFVVVEVFGGPGGGMIDILRNLTPGGIIFLLSGLIVVIGALTRVGRG
ncbi:MAG TPA: zinc-ribbon domain-containing protein [Candidatus Dormibacteraeota bacterium]|nr:zinc-ribbon domain-containing protein [Candidatus Dormibacteraeota bacterium]